MLIFLLFVKYFFAIRNNKINHLCCIWSTKQLNWKNPSQSSNPKMPSVGVFKEAMTSHPIQIPIRRTRQIKQRIWTSICVLFVTETSLFLLPFQCLLCSMFCEKMWFILAILFFDVERILWCWTSALVVFLIVYSIIFLIFFMLLCLYWWWGMH